MEKIKGFRPEDPDKRLKRTGRALEDAKRTYAIETRWLRGILTATIVVILASGGTVTALVYAIDTHSPLQLLCWLGSIAAIMGSFALGGLSFTVWDSRNDNGLKVLAAQRNYDDALELYVVKSGE
jgi:hypothetical protein